MKRIYYEMEREKFDKPYKKVEAYYPKSASEHLPPLILIETGKYRQYKDCDEIFTFDCTPILFSGITDREAYVIREAIRIFDNTEVPNA